jgi:sugar O-acyltransferase (sialic acid O-acetyltransferase NeuD family)
MNLQKVAILGAGGFGREVLDIFDAINAIEPMFDVLGFIVDSQYGKAGTLVNDKPILGGLEWLSGRQGEVVVICGVGAPQFRRRMVRQATEVGARFCSIRHPTVVASRWVSVGEGTIVAAGCVLTNQIAIGAHVHVNLDCTVGHDCTFGDFVTLSPGVHVSGNVVLREGASVGTGANLIERVTVGAWSVIGAGSTIVREVPANSVVVGVPGKVIKTRPDGWHLDLSRD